MKLLMWANVGAFQCLWMLTQGKGGIKNNQKSADIVYGWSLNLMAKIFQMLMNFLVEALILPSEVRFLIYYW